MQYEELEAIDYSPTMAAVRDTIKANEGSVSDSLYGVMALELLANDLNITDGYQKVISELEKQGTFDEYVLDYLRNSLRLSGISGDRRIESVDASECRAYVAHAVAGGLTEARESITHPRVAKFAAVLLQIESDDRVADFGSGQGFFLAIAAAHQKDADYVGYESNPSYAAVSVLRLHALGLDGDVVIRLMDVFNIPETGETFDKIFANLPMGIRYPKIPNASPWLKEIASGKRDYGKPVLFDWVHNQLVVDCLAEYGIGISITSDGALYNVSDTKPRIHFMKNNLLSHVLRLPDTYFTRPASEPSLLIFEQEDDSEGVTVIDARVTPAFTYSDTDGNTIDVTESGRTPLDDYSIYLVAQELDFDSEMLDSWNLMPKSTRMFAFGPSITILTLNDEDYGYCRLSSRSYEEEDKYDRQELGSLITHIGRGVTMTKSELEELTVSYDTGVRYLAPTSIEDGSISDDLPFLAGLTPKMEKHVLKDGDLLISRVGNPYRIAIAEVGEGEFIVPNSNIFVLKVNKEMADPYYLAAFLSSTIGERELQLASTGSHIPSLSSQTLKLIDVAIGLKNGRKFDQNKISENYRKSVRRIRESEREIKHARQKMLDVFEESIDC